jgi:hypothetical protein
MSPMLACLRALIHRFIRTNVRSSESAPFVCIQQLLLPALTVVCRMRKFMDKCDCSRGYITVSLSDFLPVTGKTKAAATMQ